MRQSRRRLIGILVLLGLLGAGLPVMVEAAPRLRPTRVKAKATLTNAPATPVTASQTATTTTATAVATCEPSLYADIIDPDQNNVELLDLLCVLEAYKGNYSSACSFAAADIAPCQEGQLTGDGIIELSDVLAMQDAISGTPACQSVCRACVKNQPPVAQAGADQSATVGEAVTFEAGQSTDPDAPTLAADGSPDRGPALVGYLWDFGDGTPPATLITPTATHPYAKPGTYTASLTVTNRCNATAHDTVLVTVTASCAGNHAPIAQLSVTLTTAAVNTPVTFSGAASADPDGPISQYWFDYGDGFNTNWQASAEVAHAYATPGTYTASLWVKDTCEAVSAAATNTVTVRERARNLSTSLRHAGQSFTVQHLCNPL